MDLHFIIVGASRLLCATGKMGGGPGLLMIYFPRLVRVVVIIHTRSNQYSGIPAHDRGL